MQCGALLSAASNIQLWVWLLGPFLRDIGNRWLAKCKSTEVLITQPCKTSICSSQLVSDGDSVKIDVHMLFHGYRIDAAKWHQAVAEKTNKESLPSRSRQEMLQDHV